MIRINGREALVSQKEAVSYQLVNPHLLYDTIPSSQAQIPVFPAVKQNREIFDYWEEPQAGAFLPELLYQHFHNGDLIREGYFLLTDASQETGYKGAFSDRLGLFFGDYQKLLLQEIDFGTLTMPGVLTPVISDGAGNACCFPTIMNESFYGANGGTIAYGGRMNAYAAGSYTASPKVPQFFVPWILKKIAAITGTTITGSFLTHPVWSQLTLTNLREVQTGTIDIRNHLPGFSIVQLILELRKVANLKFEFNSVEKSLRMDFWEDSLRAPTQRDWTKKATVAENKTPEANTRVQLSMAVDSNDALAKDKPAALADYLSPALEGGQNGIAKIDMRFSTMLTDAGTGLAICKQEGQSTQFAQEAKPWAPRLLFWNGVTGGLPRATATHTGISLSPASLAETSWKETIALRQRTFYLAKDFVLNEADIAQLDFSKKYHVDGVDYIIAQLNVGVPVKGVATGLLIGGV